ncbi:MAG: Lrp/AsnC ligand binding domain-containing protein [Anaerolineales bacterium]
MNVKRDKTGETAELLAAMAEISEVYSVGGAYDLIAIARVKSNDDLAELVTERLAKIAAIDKTDTMLAFRALPT